MVKTFGLMGDSPEKAQAEAADVLKIETALAAGQMSRVEMRDPANRYHIMTVAEVQDLTPDFDWKGIPRRHGRGQRSDHERGRRQGHEDDRSGDRE